MDKFPIFSLKKQTNSSSKIPQMSIFPLSFDDGCRGPTTIPPNQPVHPTMGNPHLLEDFDVMI